MNLLQAQSVLNQAKQIESINLDEFVQKVYPERSDLENIELVNMNMGEFMYLTRRVFGQFISEFENRENSLVLPYTFSQPPIGTTQLDAQIQSFYSTINTNNIAAAEQILVALLAYQIENGFYNKPIQRAEESISNGLVKLSEKLNLIAESIKVKNAETQKQFAELDAARKDIQTLVLQKREELSQITANLSTSNTQATQISELLTKGTDQSSRLNTLLEQQEQNKISSDKKIQELQELYNSTYTKLAESITQSASQLTDFKKQVIANEEHLTFVEGKRAFFEERIKYLEDLIGREVGASLFETFKQRKIELKDPVTFWRVAVPLMAFATVGWIFFLFSSQQQIANLEQWWQAFAINTLKSVPAIFLLLFAINQYRKERNFQEEYAFKSAVALTIEAYASRITDPASRDKLIIDAVLSVYKTPIDTGQSSSKQNKATNEMMKTMIETTRDLVKKG